ncbi:MAG TPA: tetratricopeptide repeat protein, partial [Candidatus Binatia bacterium]|nr:tetratricopeptide repeat protein [Candidatus Binatia bacterium]
GAPAGRRLAALAGVTAVVLTVFSPPFLPMLGPWPAPAIRAAEASTALVAELDAVATRYHQDPAALDRVYQALQQAAQSPAADVATLVALARAAYIWGDVRATTAEQKLAAYERGREAARRAIEREPKNAAAHFWYATNTGRWGQARGVLRSLFLLPELRREIDTVLALDPRLVGVYMLAGSVDYEVPGMFGGDLARSEALLRRGLELDPRFTGLRVALAKTLIKSGRPAEARRELEAVLAEREPSNPADWTVKDVPEARRLLEGLRKAASQP